jgi:hypothetical protein
MKNKNVFLPAALAVGFLMSFSSCRKCEVCTKDSEPEVRICEKDYDSNTEYGLAIDFREAAGYECR